jgi:uncharacterized CHY-type Zn-finger protein
MLSRSVFDWRKQEELKEIVCRRCRRKLEAMPYGSTAECGRILSEGVGGVGGSRLVDREVGEADA